MEPTPRNRRRMPLVDRAGPAPAARYDRARRRSGLVVALFGVYLGFCTAAALYHVLHVEDVVRYAEYNTTARTKVKTRRGDILDRNGVVLATDIRSDAVTADPRWVRPSGHAGSKLASDDPQVEAIRRRVARIVGRATGVSRGEIEGRLKWKRGFVYLAKHIDAVASRELRQHMQEGQLPGVRLEEAFGRYYPKGAVGGVLIGRRNWGGTIEHSLDSLLRGQTVEVLAYKDRDSDRLYFDGAPDPRKYGGRSVILTLDEKIQAVAEAQLSAAVKDAQADQGVALVMDARTAEVLAWAVAPNADPNDTAREPKRGWRNPVIQDQFEPGSTFKVLTLAAVLEEGKATLNSQVGVLGGFKTRGKVIRDSHPARDDRWRVVPVLTALETIKHSSNVGIAKLAMRIGKERLHHYRVEFGFGRSTESGLLGEVRGSLSNPQSWPKVQFANIAFGQGVAATALQVVTAFNAIAAGGIYRRPRLLRAVISPDGKNDRHFQPEKGRRIISETTASDLMKAMTAVCEPRGTATRARLPGYKMAGKTGTAQQVDPGKGYSDTHWVASFVGIVPAEQPRLVIYVAVDTPRKLHPRFPDKVLRTGGAIAAPVVREIAGFALPYLGVPQSPGAPWLAENDPIKARELAARRKAALAKAAPAPEPEAVDAGVPVLALAARDEPDRPGRSRVPDLRGLSMRAARDRLSPLGLDLRPSGSGVAIGQRPSPGVLAQTGAAVHVRFRLHSELVAAVEAEEAAP